MNPGYLSYLLISITLILLASGWKDILLRGFSHKTILLFFIGWIPCSLIRIHPFGTSIQLVLPFLLVWAAVATWRLGHPLLQLHVWTSAILLGMFDFVMLELNGWLPMLSISRPETDSALLIAFVAMLLGRSPLWQWVALTGGLVIGEAMHRMIHFSGPLPVWGGPGFQDHWWLILCLARGFTIVFEYGWRSVGGAAKSWHERRDEWRK